MANLKNNPVFHFDRATQIESWLREQWAGLFRELLKSRSQQKQLSALNLQVSELKSVNDTLKTYLEEVLSSVKPDTSDMIITEEKNKLAQTRQEHKLRSNDFAGFLSDRYDVTDSDIMALFVEPIDANDLVARIDRHKNKDGKSPARLIQTSKIAQKDYNDGRLIVGKPEIVFSDPSVDLTSKAADDTKHKVVRRKRQKPVDDAETA